MNPNPLEPPSDDDSIARQLRELAPGALADASPDPAFREALWHRTASVVRRRHLWRRLRAAAALLVAYGAGLATWRLLEPAPEPPVARLEPPASAPVDVEPDLAVESALDRATPQELEERALAAPRTRRIELLRLAGDRYLGEGRDVEAALRCYRGALRLMRPEERTLVSLQESWLFTALKSARS